MSHEADGVHRHTPWFALSIAGLLMVVALAGPALLSVDPLHQTLSAASQPPSVEWLLGTDPLGRSVLARTIAGARISLGAALLASGLTAGLGAAAGLLAAELGGTAERALLAITDTIYACPALLLVLLVTELFDGGVWMVTVSLVATRWPAFTRLCHPLARAALRRPDAEASRLLGFGRLYRLHRHAWPAVRPSIVSISALQFGNALLSIAALGFLGVGLLPPQPEWGAMIAEAIPYLGDQPVMLAAPALGIFAATWCATLLGEAYAPGDPSP
ncbi:ABC transporter permease [Acidisphaera sp. L21]|uniref:ABC transporter permease n=1 Tax=Acidisphaera sp. L21 TaxID=1641851 RepID=UPI00131E8916|nr:ABC transporter permease [Acidisphaera sp. L21]